MTKIDDDGFIECPVCEGTGRLKFNKNEYIKCEKCWGKGKLLWTDLALNRIAPSISDYLDNGMKYQRSSIYEIVSGREEFLSDIENQWNEGEKL